MGEGSPSGKDRNSCRCLNFLLTDKWTLLIQSALEGKAYEAYAALDANQSREYDEKGSFRF